MAAALKANTSLKLVSLYGNGIGVEGGEYFAETVIANQSLTSLDLEENNVSQDVLDLAKACTARNHLTFVRSNQ